MHVHLHEPGFEHKETIESVCQAAARSGFSTVCCMPNINPVNDIRKVTEYILAKAAEINLVRMLPVAAISKRREGKWLSEYKGLKQAGILGLEYGLRVGRPPDITIIDPDRSYTVDTAEFRSLSRNTPFGGWQLNGKPVLTMVGGRIVYEF